ncbi:hypothetical protein K493DRAFT_336906 [Basidiobolus meristosporus CBS 931.73]|uniref:Extracellular membrane protein CFEM domain-containing protein n=1 Tax=Basidiobolus meristosporus CBS 931.73 TaxID=1314790 RepID=A0A1Y1YEI2_9FUNG|nr:hypothetical protein K493DRAFT_336906 [Basidiobolus meristosporus CBS 931.73]|eukprot:ORX96451.1 hypothetical protein K493DRAFT_336906 [Basidiobolus meristosporus CBS 931.73]
MKWIAQYTLFATLSALAAFGQSTTSTSSSAAASSTPLTPLESCIMQQNCAPADVACRAKCAQVPNPNASMVNSTINCVAQCDQSNAAAYAQCKNNCINTYYGPNPSGSTGNGSTGSGSGTNPTNGSGTSGSGNNTANGNTKPNSASYMMASTMALVGTLGAAFSLL